MSSVAEIEFKYFSPVKGRVVQRFGTESFIGASRSPKGFIVNPEAVVAIPAAEVAKYPKEYRNCRTRGDLVERSKADFEAWQDRRRAKSEAAAQDKKRLREADQKQAAEAARLFDVQVEQDRGNLPGSSSPAPETAADNTRPTPVPPQNDPPPAQGSGGKKRRKAAKKT